MKRPPKPSSNHKIIAQVVERSEELQAQIRIRAYELYEQRGREDGRELDDWLKPEAELARQKAKAVGA